MLDALPHLVAPSRRTRRLIQRPYFDEARAVFEIVAPTCGGNPEVLASFLSDPEAWLEGRAGANRRAEPPRRFRLPAAVAGVAGVAGAAAARGIGVATGPRRTRSEPRTMVRRLPGRT